MIRRILIGVAGTPTFQTKIDYLVDLAQRHEAEVGIVSVLDVRRLAFVGSVPLGAGQHAQELREKRVERSRQLDEDAIAKIEVACAKAGVAVRLIQDEAQPLERLKAAWRYHDLCLLGARGWFEFDVFPQPQEHLLNLVASGVRPILGIPEQFRPVRRALIAYNGSLQSAKAMKRFVQMSLWPDTKLHVTCVGEPKSHEKPAHLLDQAAEYCRLYGHDPEISHIDTAHAQGGASRALLAKVAEAEADLIVVGSSYRKVLLSHRLGRTALDLVKTSEVPVFLTH
ncbi:MAG: universal stress protein [Pseudomonadota bacterium]